MSIEPLNRDVLSRITGGDLRTIRFFEAIAAFINDDGSQQAGGLLSLGFVRRITVGASLVAGTDYPGTDLAFAGFRSNGTTFSATTGGTALTGTWRALGTAIPGAGDFAYTLAIRVA